MNLKYVLCHAGASGNALLLFLIVNYGDSYYYIISACKNIHLEVFYSKITYKAMLNLLCFFTVAYMANLKLTT